MTRTCAASVLGAVTLPRRGRSCDPPKRGTLVVQAITNITERDLLEFELFKKRSCQRGRVPRIVFALAPPLAIIAAVLTLLAFFAPQPVWLPRTLLPLLATLPCYFLFFRSVNRRRAARTVHKLLHNEDISALLGEHNVA